MNTQQVTFDGEEQLMANLKDCTKEMTEELARAMFTFGGKIMSRSTELTPLKTGELRRRAFVEGPLEDEDGSYTVVVGYEKHDTPVEGGNFYAVPVHERLDAHHETGQAKFLETALKELSSEYLEYLAEAVRDMKK